VLSNFLKGRNSVTGDAKNDRIPVLILRALINSGTNIHPHPGPSKSILDKFYYSKIVRKMFKPLRVLHYRINL